mmetsp:Transcript_20142/g.51457  ORF Transcript_20142/g.51457 Transcript_20142/m.51457 type:complete len:532 (-) Transcript_20142:77-1672(-)
MNVVWKGTFIDVASEPTAPLLKRSHSEPPADFTSRPSSLFDAERDYVATLETKAGQLKSPSKEKKVARHSHARTQSRGSSTTGSTPSVFESNGSNASTTGSTPFGSHQSDAGSDNEPSSLSARDLSSLRFNASCSKASARPSRPRAEEPVESAIQLVEELPEQLAEELQQRTLDIVGGVQSQVTGLCQAVMTSGATPAQCKEAIEHLAQIPDLVMTSSNEAVAEVKAALRDQIQEIAKTAHKESADLIENLQALPMEAERVTLSMAKASLQRSALKVTQHMDSALELAPNCKALAEGTSQMLRCVSAAPIEVVAHSVTLKAAQHIERAVAAATGIMQHSVRNQDLAASIIQGKAMSWSAPSTATGAHGAALTASSACKSGSVGHPELCKRPCIHFARGDCSAGANCIFCHLPHSGRSPHLDKRHRDLLQKLPFCDRVALALPTIRRQVARLGITPEAKQLLEALGSFACSAKPARQNPATASLSSALGALSLRSLMTAVCKAADTPDWLKLDVLEEQLERIRSLEKAHARR